MCPPSVAGGAVRRRASAVSTEVLQRMYATNSG